MNCRLDFINLSGYLEYHIAHDLMLEKVFQRKEKIINDTVLFLEHKPVVTLGKNASSEGLLVDEKTLKAMNTEFARTERGGQTTYHCPGQLVAYTIFDLHSRKIGVSAFVKSLEDIMINSFSDLGLKTIKKEGLIGVFCQKPPHGKVGALGIRVSQGITFHGLSMNINPDLKGFDLIIPCGLTNVSVTSVQEQTGKSPGMNEVRKIVENNFKMIFGKNC
jgi:lipoyl(octanoyl) transferase